MSPEQARRSPREAALQRAHWARKAATYDVFAPNVLGWVKSKGRFLAFLGRFPELVFEGHDELATETERLRSVGFTDIEVVGRSERGRYVLHCRNTRWQH